MRLINITSYSIGPAKAIAFKDRKGDMYFNIRHGGIGGSSYYCSISVHKDLGQPADMGETMQMTQQNYTLIPIYDKKNERFKKDRKGNSVYYVTEDNINDHRNDYVALWDIPNKLYKDVKYTIIGKATVLAEGSKAIVRDDITYTSPSPILEILGPCKLFWSAKTMDGMYTGQEIEFDGKDWTCGNVEFKDGPWVAAE